MNQVQLIGRTTKDVELRYTQSNTAVTRFTLAVNRRKKEDGADFIQCTAWGKQAELMSKYVHKGDRIGITGRIQTGKYDKNGQTVYTTDIVLESLDFLSSPQEPSQEPKNDFVPADGDPFEGLPF